MALTLLPLILLPLMLSLLLLPLPLLLPLLLLPLPLLAEAQSTHTLAESGLLSDSALLAGMERGEAELEAWRTVGCHG